MPRRPVRLFIVSLTALVSMIGAGAGVGGIAQAGAAGVNQAVSTRVMSMRVGGPMIPVGHRMPAGSVASFHNTVSTNWAGYVAEGASGSFSGANAVFVVPTLDCATSPVNSAVSTWVGLDGWNDTTVEQDGVDAICSGGSAYYVAWYEMYPAPSVEWSSVVVSAGDLISAGVQPGGTGKITLSLTDSTSHTSASATVSNPYGMGASAECIVEDPAYSNGTEVPFPNFGPVKFSSCTATSGSNPEPIGTFGPLAVDIANPQTLAVTSPLSDLSAFNVVRSNSSNGLLSRDVTSMAALPDGDGYWLVSGSGSVSAHGAAESYGDVSSLALNAPIAHIIPTVDGLGYWLVASDGGVFSFGDAVFYGSMGAAHLNAPVMSLAPTNDGRGYWLVASDGGVFSFGDATFLGSMGGEHLNEPVVGIAGDASSRGYWLVAADGGIFAFGAPFYGSTGNLALVAPIESMSATPSSRGYRFVASDGGVFNFGDATFYGSLGGEPLSAPIVAMAGDNVTGGYWLVDANGTVSAFNAPWYGSH